MIDGFHVTGMTPDGDPMGHPCDCDPGECPFNQEVQAR